MSVEIKQIDLISLGEIGRLWVGEKDEVCPVLQ